MTKKINYVVVLHRKGLLNAAQLAEAQELSKAAGIRVREAIVQLGYVSHKDVAEALEEIVRTRAENNGWEYVDLAQFEIPPEVIALVPESIAREYFILPCQEDEDGTLWIATSNPGDLETLNKIRRVLNRPIEPVLASKGAIEEALDSYYKSQQQAAPPTQPSPQATPMATYFYTDANGQRRGPIDAQQLASLAAQGVVTPTTPMETEGGHKGVAGQIPGLTFKAVVPPLVDRPTQVPPSSPATPTQVYCTNCGNTVSEVAVACMSCGVKPIGHKKFCRLCGGALNPEQVICTNCGTEIKTSLWKTAEAITEMGARSYGQWTSRSSSLAWLTDFAFRDIRFPVVYLRLVQVFYAITFIVSLLAAIVVPCQLVYSTFSAFFDSDSSQENVIFMVVWNVFLTLGTWFFLALNLLLTRLMYEFGQMLVDWMVETTKAARLIIAEGQSGEK